MILEVAICTIDEGILRVPEILLGFREDVKYLISYQYTDIKYLEYLNNTIFQRADVTVTCLEGKGLARNRNNALKHATGDIVLIADDDVKYDDDSFDIVLRHFKSDKDLSVASFQALGHDDKLLHRYSSKSFGFAERPRGTYYNSAEVAVRRIHDLPEFDERFGLGAAFLTCGEEEVFIFDAYKSGLKVIYFPEQIVRVPKQTTGTKFNDDSAVQRTKGAVLCKMYGSFGAFLRCVKFAIVHPHIKNRLRALYEMFRGIIYIGYGTGVNSNTIL